MSCATSLSRSSFGTELWRNERDGRASSPIALDLPRVYIVDPKATGGER